MKKLFMGIMIGISLSANAIFADETITTIGEMYIRESTNQILFRSPGGMQFYYYYGTNAESKKLTWATLLAAKSNAFSVKVVWQLNGTIRLVDQLIIDPKS